MSIKRKKLNKEFEQKMALEKVIKQSFDYQKKELDETNRRTINNLMNWNKKHLSPTGGKKAFKGNHRDGFITKSDD